MRLRMPPYLGLAGPYLIEVVVNLGENWMSFLDTGVGMGVEQIARACAPHVSFKENRKHGLSGTREICTVASRESV